MEKQILQFFGLSSPYVKYDSLSQEDKILVQEFMDQHAPNQQINQQMLKNSIENSHGNYVHILTKKIQVALKKPSRFGSNKNQYILQKVMVNPLFQRQGIFKRFLKTLQNSLPKNSIIIIESVIGENLEKYIQKYPHEFAVVQGTQNNYRYKG